MIIKLAVLNGEVHTVQDVPEGSTLEYVAQKADVPTNGTFKSSGQVLNLDSAVTDGMVILMTPAEGKYSGSVDEPVEELAVVSFLVKRYLAKDVAATTATTVGELARMNGLPACGTEITLNGVVVSRADFLVDGAEYEVKEVPCHDEDEDEDDCF